MSIEGGVVGYLNQIDWNGLDQYSEAVSAELTGAFRMAFQVNQPGLAETTAFVRASAYAKARTAELMSADGPMSLTRLARADLTRIVGGGLERGDSLDTIARNIRQSGAYSKERASTIARTETATAIGHGAMSAAREVGSGQKNWLPNGSKACDICNANGAQDWIGIGDDFADGSSTIPAHPNCECDVIYRGEQISGIDASEGLGSSEDDEDSKMLVTSRCPNDGKLLKAAPHPASVELWCRRCKRSVLPVGVEMRVKSRVDVPSYISANAERGLAWNADGLAGDGLVDRTVREARELAAGSVTEDKVRRMSAWFARHLVDLDRPNNSNPDNEDYPGAGAVAWALWGGSPTNPRQAMDWADAKVAALDRETVAQ